MIKEGVEAVLREEKAAFELIESAKLKAEEIKRKGLEEAADLLNRAKDDFERERRQALVEVEQGLESFAKDLLEQHHRRLSAISERYQKTKHEIPKRIFFELLNRVKGS